MIERFAAIDRHIETHLDGWLAELTALCRVPSVSARHEDRGVRHPGLRSARRRGFESEVLPSDGHPVVLAHSRGPMPAGPCLKKK
jgi:hypothetical protein